MAINQENIALQIAEQGVAQAGALITALNRLLELQKWGTKAGINLMGYDSNIGESPDLMHTNGAYLNKLIGKMAPDLASWLETQSTNVNGAGSRTFEEIINQCRRA